MATITVSEVENIVQDNHMNVLVDALNRSSIALPLFGRGTYDGGEIKWPVRFEQNNAAGPISEGADVSSSSNDIVREAQVSFTTYHDHFQINSLALSRSMAATSPKQVANRFLLEASASVERIAEQIDEDFIDGDGSSAALLGLVDSTNGMILSTGTFAGLAQGTYGEWAGEAVDGGASVFDMEDTRTLRTQLYTGRGRYPNIWMGAPSVFDHIAAKFDASGGPKRVMVDALKVRGREITFPYGVDHVMLHGAPLIANRNMALGDGLLALTAEDVGIYAMNPVLKGNEFAMPLKTQAEAQLNTTSTNFFVKFKRLAESGDYEKWGVFIYVACIVKDRGKHGRIHNFTLS